MAPTKEKIMSKFISTCCVCGKVYCVTTQADGKDVERVSHGYCGKDCAEQTPVQIAIWDDKLNCHMLDAANMTAGGRIYHHLKAIDTLVTINKKDKRIESLFWDDVMYEIAEFEPFTNEEHGNRLIKEAAKRGEFIVL